MPVPEPQSLPPVPPAESLIPTAPTPVSAAAALATPAKPPLVLTIVLDRNTNRVTLSSSGPGGTVKETTFALCSAITAVAGEAQGMIDKAAHGHGQG